MPAPRLVAVSLKMYLGAAATRSWVAAVAELVGDHESRPGGGGGVSGDDQVEIAVLPSFPLLESTAALLQGTRIAWGGQDVAPDADGAQTGEVSADLLAELGCTYVEVGHAERRRFFGETDEMIAAKITQIVRAGLVPIACVGEQARGRPEDAAAECVRQLDVVLDAAGDAQTVVAYEPVWAIGADASAPAEHIATVCAALTYRLSARGVRGRVVYGGSAGPGTYPDIAHVADGLFLGRFAHDPHRLAAVVAEVATHPTQQEGPHS